MILANLFLLLMGFALLSRHFEKSRVPLVLPRFLPADWKGGFVLLVMVFVLSSFLDNIAAALIGGAMAHQLFRAQGAHRLSRGHRRGVQRRRRRQRDRRHDDDDDVDRRRVAGRGVRSLRRARSWRWSSAAFPAAKQQHAYSPMIKHVHEHTHVDWVRVGIVALILVCAIVANVTHQPRGSTT